MDTSKDLEQNVSAEFLSPSVEIPYSANVIKAMGKTSEDKVSASGVEWIEPPLDLLGLKTMVDNSTILPQCCTAYGSNIAGTGFSLEYKEDVSGTDENKEMRAEWDKARGILDTLSTEYDATEVFVNALTERERCGIAYIECVRNMEGNVVEIYNLLDTETVRKSKEDENRTNYTFYLRGEPTVRSKRFRKYRQEVNGKTVYYKEFADPRTMDWRTGEYVSKGEKLDVQYQANELLELRIGNEHYGKVRWAGQILAIDGSHAAEVLNCNYFHNGRHTPMMILITGGHLTEASRQEIRKYLAAVKGEQGQHSFLLMEVDAKKGATAFDEEKSPKIEIKDLGPMLQTDALFTNYLDDNRKKVQSAFRLPDVYVAYTTSYNKATVQAAIQLTEQQVFSAERKSVEWIVNNKLLNTYGFKYVNVKLDAPVMTDEDAKYKLMSLYASNGGLTPNMAKQGFYDAIGAGTAENYPGEWGDIPLSAYGKTSDAGETDQTDKSDEEVANATTLPDNEQNEQNESNGEELADEVEEQVEKAARDGASEQTLYVLRQTRNLLRQLAKSQGGAVEQDG